MGLYNMYTGTVDVLVDTCRLVLSSSKSTASCSVQCVSSQPCFPFKLASLASLGDALLTRPAKSAPK